MLNKKVLFISGTRADFGKLKSLMLQVKQHQNFDLNIFATGMHMLSKYGMTVNEIEKSGFDSVFKYINHNSTDSMDVILAKTVLGLSDYVKEIQPDMIVVHGDRVEALAGAIVGSLNNILVSHIEGGEVSGTIDEIIRHSVSKMSHIHFVSNKDAKRRLMQLGEQASSIFEVGSPDLDIMLSQNLPKIEEVKYKYEIPFDEFSILMHHPVTTELEGLKNEISNVVAAAVKSERNYIVIYPNNDHGSEVILDAYDVLKGNEKFKVYPSIRFECFLSLLKNAEFMIGNSSAGVREAPFYGLPSINIGTRQLNRSSAPSIINCEGECEDVTLAIKSALENTYIKTREFGRGNSDVLFLRALLKPSLWAVSKQKVFEDLKI